jgi:hypothetical protein
MQGPLEHLLVIEAAPVTSRSIEGRPPADHGGEGLAAACSTARLGASHAA